MAMQQRTFEYLGEGTEINTPNEKESSRLVFFTFAFSLAFLNKGPPQIMSKNVDDIVRSQSYLS